MSPIERPYPSPLTHPWMVARVEMARSAESWRADIEAMLVESGMTTELTDTVIGLVDKTGYSVTESIDVLRRLLDSYPPQLDD